MQIRTILYQYIKTLIKHVFLLNFTYELLMSFRILYTVFPFVFTLEIYQTLRDVACLIHLPPEIIVL